MNKTIEIPDVTSKYKKIIFKSDDKQQCFETDYSNCYVYGSTNGLHHHGSSRLKWKNIVNYNWEVKYYPGRLVAVHIDKNHYAYTITKVFQKTGHVDMIRVVNKKTDQRALIKGIESEVLDIQFAFIKTKVLFACIDKTSLFVHKIENLANKLVCTLLLTIQDPITGYIPKYDSINWCPYVPEIDNVTDDELASEQLIWVHGHTFHCYLIPTIIDKYGIGIHKTENIIEGSLKHNEISTITGCVFSTDGSTLAISSADGMIRFYQVYYHTNQKDPRCIHSWEPHGGEIVSSFFFLDNITDYSPDPLWRHAITTSKNNSEIKVWCCSTWECVQIIKFQSLFDNELYFKAALDRTASYLVLSDAISKTLFVLQIQISNYVDQKIPRKIKTSSPSSTTTLTTATTLTAAPIPSTITTTTVTANEPTSNSSTLITSTTTTTPKLISSKIITLKPSSLSPSSVKSISPIVKTDEPIENGSDRNGNGIAITDDDIDDDDDDDDDDEDIRTDNDGTPKVIDNTIAFIKSVSEFTVPSPILSFDIVSAAIRKYKCLSPNLFNQFDDGDDDSKIFYSVVLQMYLMQPKSLQECHLFYQPTVTESCEIQSSMSDTGSDPVFDTEYDNSTDDDCNINKLKPNNDVLLRTSDDKTKVSDYDMNQPFKNNGKIEDTNKQLNQSIQSVKSNESKRSQESNKSLTHQQVQPQQTKQLKTQQQNLIKPTTLSSETKENTNLNDLKINNNLTKSINLMTPDSFNSPGDITPSADGVSKEVLSTLLMLAKTTSTSILSPTTDSKPLSNVLNRSTDEVKDPQIPEKTIEDISSKKFLAADQRPGSSKTLESSKPNATSIGSSPSREVQEILSLKDSDLNEYYDDPSDVMDENDDAEMISDMAALENQLLQDNKQMRTNANMNDWSHLEDAPLYITQMQYKNLNQYNEMNKKMDILLERIQSQTGELSELRNEVSKLQETRNEDLKTFKHVVQNIEGGVIKLIETNLKHYEQEHKKNLETFTTLNERQNQIISDNLLKKLPTIINKQLMDNLASVILKDLEHNLFPMINGKLNSMTKLLQNDLAKKLTSSDQLIKENMTNICQNKELLEIFGNSILLGVRSGLEQNFNETLRNVLIPSYEKATGEMFVQMRGVLHKSTEAYTKNIEQFSKQYQPIYDDINSIVKNLPEYMKSIIDRSTGICYTQLTNDFKILQANLMKTVHDNIKDEIQKCFETQTATIHDSVLSVVSQAQTPAPSIFDVQEQIKQLLHKEKVNKAFHKALLANDLSLVEFVLEKADYETVFDPCVLEQKVLLSLIQQLSTDMSNYSELKHNYLSAAVLCLKLHDPVINQHAPKVMKELYQNCKNFLSRHPKGTLCNYVKMLIIALKSMGFAIDG